VPLIEDTRRNSKELLDWRLAIVCPMRPSGSADQRISDTRQRQVFVFVCPPPPVNPSGTAPSTKRGGAGGAEVDSSATEDDVLSVD
jgi:hypothetical protein